MYNKDNNSRWCVYKHISPSGKCYIGITSQKPNKRFNNGNGYKQNKYFYNAIQKYGWDNFEHKIMFENITEQKAKEYEIDLINKYKSDDRLFGYNITKGGESSNGLKFSKETLFKLSNSRKGRLTGEKNPMYGKIGTLHPLYGKHVSDDTKEKMRKSLIGRKQSLKTRKKKSDSHKGSKHSEDTLDKMGLKVYQYSLNGEYINLYYSAREASRQTNVNNSSICYCCTGKYKTAGGFIWSYSKDINVFSTTNGTKKYVIQYDKNYQFINIFESLVDAQKSTGIKRGLISACCNGRSKTSCGYIWRFASIEEIKRYKKAG